MSDERNKMIDRKTAFNAGLEQAAKMAEESKGAGKRIAEKIREQIR